MIIVGASSPDLDTQRLRPVFCSPVADRWRDPALSILAYEFAIAGLRYSAGVAVAMSIVPALLLLIIILGRYMQGDPDATDERGNP